MGAGIRLGGSRSPIRNKKGSMAIRSALWRVRKSVDPTPHRFNFGGWTIILSIILSPGLSCAVPRSVFPVEPAVFPAAQMPIPPQEQDIKTSVEAEVDRAFRHKLSSVNLLLILLLVLPTLAAGCLWFLMAKFNQQTVFAQREIETLKADTLSQLEIIISEARTILSDLQQQNAEVDRALESLKTQSNLQLPRRLSPENQQKLKLAQDYAKQGDKFFTQGCYDEAVEAYDRGLQLDSQAAEVWNNRGVVLTKLHRYHEAIASYEQALQLRSEYADAWNNRGVALGKLKYYDAAILSYDRAIRIREDYVDAWNNRGFSLAQLQRFDEAIDSYQKAAELNPDFYLVWYNQARCYGMQGEADLALENLQKAIEIKPSVVQNLAKKENDFASILYDERFQKMLDS